MTFTDQRPNGVPIVMAGEALALGGDGPESESPARRVRAREHHLQPALDHLAKRNPLACRVFLGISKQGIGYLHCRFHGRMIPYLRGVE